MSHWAMSISMFRMPLMILPIVLPNSNMTTTKPCYNPVLTAWLMRQVILTAQAIFATVDLHWQHWVMAVLIAASVLVLDEARKAIHTIYYS